MLIHRFIQPGDDEDEGNKGKDSLIEPVMVSLDDTGVIGIVDALVGILSSLLFCEDNNEGWWWWCEWVPKVSFVSFVSI